MRLRQVEALVLMYLTACAGVPRAPPYGERDSEEASLAVARYEVHVLSEENSPAEPVRVSSEEFQRAMRMLAPEVVRSGPPMEVARLLMEGGLSANLLAEV